MDAIETTTIGSATSARPLAVRIREACRLTGIGRSKLYELIRAGEIGTFKVGAMTLIAMTELERFLAVQMNSGQIPRTRRPTHCCSAE